MSLLLAQSAYTDDAVERGASAIRESAQRERKRMEEADRIARNLLPERGKRVAEVTLIDTVKQQAHVSDYLASYVVDKLRTIGAVQKDWVTGELTVL